RGAEADSERSRQFERCEPLGEPAKDGGEFRCATSDTRSPEQYLRTSNNTLIIKAHPLQCSNRREISASAILYCPRQIPNHCGRRDHFANTFVCDTVLRIPTDIVYPEAVGERPAQPIAARGTVELRPLPPSSTRQAANFQSVKCAETRA